MVITDNNCNLNVKRDNGKILAGLSSIIIILIIMTHCQLKLTVCHLSANGISLLPDEGK